MDKAERLERMVMGLEQTIEATRNEIPYYKPEDIQGRYARKFLTALEEQLERVRKELEAVKTSPPPEGN